MNPFELDVLIGPASAIFFITLAISFQVTRDITLSVVVAFFKAGIFSIYFGLVFDGTYTVLDDWSYLLGGQKFLYQGVGITNLAENWEFAKVKKVLCTWFGQQNFQLE